MNSSERPLYAGVWGRRLKNPDGTLYLSDESNGLDLLTQRRKEPEPEIVHDNGGWSGFIKLAKIPLDDS